MVGHSMMLSRRRAACLARAKGWLRCASCSQFTPPCHAIPPLYHNIPYLLYHIILYTIPRHQPYHAIPFHTPPPKIKSGLSVNGWMKTDTFWIKQPIASLSTAYIYPIPALAGGFENTRVLTQDHRGPCYHHHLFWRHINAAHCRRCQHKRRAKEEAAGPEMQPSQILTRRSGNLFFLGPSLSRRKTFIYTNSRFKSSPKGDLIWCNTWLRSCKRNWSAGFFLDLSLRRKNIYLHK